MQRFKTHTRQSAIENALSEHGSKIDRNSVFDCHLSPLSRQMAIKNSVTNVFYLCSSIVLQFSIVA